MNRMRSRVVVAAALTGLLAAAAPGWSAEGKNGPGQVVEGAKQIGEGVEQTAKGIGKTVTDGANEIGTRAKNAGRDAKPVGDRLHDSAKGFGEALWDGMKYVGRTLEHFFTGKR